jgi:hypothetical protein
LIGAIFPALVKDGGFLTDGIWLIGYDQMPYSLLLENVPADPDEVESKISEIAENIHEHLGEGADATLFMVFDAMLPNIGTLLDAFYLHLANRVHYAGVNAGSETFQPMPCLFDSDRLIHNGMLLVLLKNNKGPAVEHGYRTSEKSIFATSTENNRISQIDWRPAFEVYQELVRAQYGVEMNRGNFYQLAVHYPLGIVRANHQVVVRIPVMLDEDGSLFCIGEIPANSVLTLLQRPVVDSGETLRALYDGLIQRNGDPAGRDLLLFFCAGRRLHLGMDAASAELQAFKSMTRAGQVAGALSLGEIGASALQGYPIFHNAALVALER